MAGVVADAATGNWVDRYAPALLRPYLRLSRADRPVGAWLLLWPCWWSAALAALVRGEPFPNLLHLALFTVGAFAMRGAGCTYNDMVDRDIDRLVERTSSRPLPAGDVGVFGASVWLVLQALVGLAVLLQFNRFTIALGLASLAVVATYPFMKRFTSWPQAVLGLAFSWGALMGWAAAFGSLDWAPLVLYLATVAWVIGYDTIYACQDKEDDAIVGVGSTARLFGDYAKPGVALFYAIAVGLMALAFTLGDASLFTFIGLGAFAAHLIGQVVLLDIDDSARCLKLFRSNRDAGALLFVGLALDAFVLWL
jgi:4-hydroxybenzoate polyprenyltransferase